MSKRNFILLIIVLAVIVLATFLFLYSSNREIPPGINDGGTGTNFISRFNPFGRSNPAPVDETPPADVSGFIPGNEEMGKMTRISSMPVAGFVVFQKERFQELPVVPVESETEESEVEQASPTEFAGATRYVDRVTGNVYQTFIDKIEERKFSDTLIPKVYEARFGNDGESVVMRYLKSDGETIETFVGTLPEDPLGADTTSLGEIEGYFLPENVKDVSISPDTLDVFYLFTLGDGIVGTVLNLLDEKKSQIFDSPFTEWLSLWPSEKIITLSTKPSWNIPGYMYTLDPKKKTFTKTFGGVNGLVTLASPNGNLALFSNNNLSLSIYHTDTRTVDSLGLRTLAEKCVWAKASTVVYCAVPKSIVGAQYPDTWYQGEVSFGDQFWKIDVESGNTTLVVDPASVLGVEVDGTKLALDEGGGYLLFVDKKDSLLWRIDLSLE